MFKNKVHQIIESSYNMELADKILDSYNEIEGNFFLEKWKPSELDAGHFVEALRRLIEQELTSQYTPFNKKLTNFNDIVLKQYEQQKGHESFRMIIPRILKTIYNIRNKRGVGHINDVSPNEMDSLLILNSTKWILSEIVRLKSKLSIADTQELIDNIVERNVDLLWKNDSFTRVLNTNIPASEKVLLLLYDTDNQYVDELQKIIEYQNKSNFSKLIISLHKNRFIEKQTNGFCLISPKGVIKAEKILKKYKKFT